MAGRPMDWSAFETAVMALLYSELPSSGKVAYPASDTTALTDFESPGTEAASNTVSAPNDWP